MQLEAPLSAGLFVAQATQHRPGVMASQIISPVNQLFSLISHPLSCISCVCGVRGVGHGDHGVGERQRSQDEDSRRWPASFALLKSGMADMQGRLDALLIEIGTELEQVCKAGEPTAEVLPDRQDVEERGHHRGCAGDCRPAARGRGRSRHGAAGRSTRRYRPIVEKLSRPPPRRSRRSRQPRRPWRSRPSRQLASPTRRRPAEVTAVEPVDRDRRDRGPGRSGGRSTVRS